MGHRVPGVSWIGHLFSKEARAQARARQYADDGRYDEALELLAPFSGPEGAPLRQAIQERAARHWLNRALAACEAGDGARMRRHLARARRYHHTTLDPLFIATDRTIRAAQLRLTAAEHWVGLVEAAEAQTARVRYGLFASPHLLARVAKRWELPDDTLRAPQIEAADRHALRALIPLLAARYPDDLAASLPALGEELVRAVLLIASSRPDRAALPLVELPESDPVVCFERARVAYLLGREDLALTALQGFASQAGGHRTLRRLNTGVFLAQMAVSVGDRRRALHVLDGLPVRFLGRRPVILYARLLLEAGRLADAVALLETHQIRHADHHEARLLLDEARNLRAGNAPLPRFDPSTLRRGLRVVSDDYSVAPPRTQRPPAALAGPPSGDEL